MDPGTKGRSYRGIGYICRNAYSARRAANCQSTVPLHKRLDRRQLNGLVLAYQIGRQIG
jgi:hypothetical protein